MKSTVVVDGWSHGGGAYWTDAPGWPSQPSPLLPSQKAIPKSMKLDKSIVFNLKVIKIEC